MSLRKSLSLAGAGFAMMGAIVATAPSAQAATSKNGVCETGEFCLYFNSNHTGSMVDLGSGVKDYGSGSTCVKFITAGSGRGQCVKNHAASVWNREAAAVTVFYKSGWAGSIDAIGSGSKVNLKSTLKNENAGHVVGNAANSRMTTGLYKTSGGRITAYFDGYLNTSGRHEGTDMARGIGSPVYAMLGGTITRVTQGARGGSGLSQIAVYNAGQNKTLVYLHTDPLDGLRVGQSIAKGARIATEDWRGVSSSGAAHTHVEMRAGRQTSAAKSVGDPVLSNPNPTSFWMSNGFNVCCD
ncbi:peptidase inhibitor family I36 protein [Oryzobacter telluris]|uniref:peptidase inhibitor family I36 protein n=1 Tax=Oryzobacter telluris TaxID=3149179 RepID=UPI00370D5D5C